MTFQKFLSLVFDASRPSLEAKADGTQWKEPKFYTTSTSASTVNDSLRGALP